MPSETVRRALIDIYDNIATARAFVADLDLAAFAASRLHLYAAIRALEIVSEASRRLPEEMRARHPELPWRAIRDSGNFYRHQYDNVLETFVWTTVHDDLPPLLAAVEQELARIDGIGSTAPPSAPAIDRREDLTTARDARPDDRAAIVAAIAELQDYERRLSDTRLPGAGVAAAYCERLREAAETEGAFLVVEAEGAFAGFAVGWIENDDEICETPDSNRFGYVSDICVIARFRGRRLAQALLQTLEARLKAHGVTRLRLNLLAANASARAAYERAGYAPYEATYEKRIG